MSGQMQADGEPSHIQAVDASSAQPKSANDNIDFVMEAPDASSGRSKSATIDGDPNATENVEDSRQVQETDSAEKSKAAIVHEASMLAVAAAVQRMYKGWREWTVTMVSERMFLTRRRWYSGLNRRKRGTLPPNVLQPAKGVALAMMPLLQDFVYMPWHSEQDSSEFRFNGRVLPPFRDSVSKDISQQRWKRLPYSTFADARQRILRKHGRFGLAKAMKCGDLIDAVNKVNSVGVTVQWSKHGLPLLEGEPESLIDRDYEGHVLSSQASSLNSKGQRPSVTLDFGPDVLVSVLKISFEHGMPTRSHVLLDFHLEVSQDLKVWTSIFSGPTGDEYTNQSKEAAWWTVDQSAIPASIEQGLLNGTLARFVKISPLTQTNTKSWRLSLKNLKFEGLLAMPVPWQVEEVESLQYEEVQNRRFIKQMTDALVPSEGIDSSAEEKSGDEVEAASKNSFVDAETEERLRFQLLRSIFAETGIDPLQANQRVNALASEAALSSNSKTRNAVFGEHTLNGLIQRACNLFWMASHFGHLVTLDSMKIEPPRALLHPSAADLINRVMEGYRSMETNSQDAASGQPEKDSQTPDVHPLIAAAELVCSIGSGQTKPQHGRLFMMDASFKSGMSRHPKGVQMETMKRIQKFVGDTTKEIEAYKTNLHDSNLILKDDVNAWEFIISAKFSAVDTSNEASVRSAHRVALDLVNNSSPFMFAKLGEFPPPPMYVTSAIQAHMREESVTVIRVSLLKDSALKLISGVVALQAKRKYQAQKNASSRLQSAVRRMTDMKDFGENMIANRIIKVVKAHRVRKVWMQKVQDTIDRMWREKKMKSVVLLSPFFKRLCGVVAQRRYGIEVCAGWWKHILDEGTHQIVQVGHPFKLREDAEVSAIEETMETGSQAVVTVGNKHVQAVKKLAECEAQCDSTTRELPAIKIQATGGPLLKTDSQIQTDPIRFLQSPTEALEEATPSQINVNFDSSVKTKKSTKQRPVKRVEHYMDQRQNEPKPPVQPREAKHSSRSKLFSREKKIPALSFLPELQSEIKKAHHESVAEQISPNAAQAAMANALREAYCSGNVDMMHTLQSIITNSRSNRSSKEQRMTPRPPSASKPSSGEKQASSAQVSSGDFVIQRQGLRISPQGIFAAAINQKHMHNISLSRDDIDLVSPQIDPALPHGVQKYSGIMLDPSKLSGRRVVRVLIYSLEHRAHRVALHRDIASRLALPDVSSIPPIIGAYTLATSLSVAVVTPDQSPSLSLSQCVAMLGPPPDRAAAVILGDIISTLRSIHSKSLIHGSINPFSIMLSLKGKVHLSNMHECVHAEDPSAKQGSQESPANLARRFHSPERLLLMSRSPADDIWSLGMTTAAIFTEKVGPDSGMTSGVQEVLESSLEMLQSLYHPGCRAPPELASFVSGCVEKYPSQRKTAGQLLQSSFFSHHGTASSADVAAWLSNLPAKVREPEGSSPKQPIDSNLSPRNYALARNKKDALGLDDLMEQANLFTGVDADAITNKGLMEDITTVSPDKIEEQNEQQESENGPNADPTQQKHQDVAETTNGVKD